MDRECDEEQALEREEDQKKSLGKGLPQILHDRARRSAEELHKLILSFSTAILAIYFLALTTRIEPTLTNYQITMSILGIFSAGVAIVSGMISLLADTKRNYYRACAIQSLEQKDKENYYSLRDLWLKRQRHSTFLLRVLFIVGILSSTSYIILRILNK